MADELPAPEAARDDHSRVGLALVHRWLLGPGEKDLEGQLAELAAAFGAPAAGLGPPEGELVARVGGSGPLPWADRPEVLQALRRAATAGRVAGTEADWLCALVRAGGLDWLLWLEPSAGREWTGAEAAALTLAGQALALRLQAEEGSGWVAQVERAARQRRLEEAALVTRRLAHDYGNVLTSILGFTELSLGQASGETPLKRYLNEIHRAVQQGAQLTNRLRLFARRPAPTGQVVRLPDVLA